MSKWKSKINGITIHVFSEDLGGPSGVRFMFINQRDGKLDFLLGNRYFNHPDVLIKNFDPLDDSALMDYMRWK